MKMRVFSRAGNGCAPTRWGLLPFSICWLTALVGTALSAEDLPQMVCVEEEWELVVSTPDPQSTAPQVTTAFSPIPNMNWLHVTFELNHQSQPEYVSGGMQLQVWQGETPIACRKFPHNDVMANDDETVRWTQRMTIQDGMLTFEIINGSSQTWGAFGGQGYMRATLETDLPNLNGYRPIQSVQNSGVGYAANRVQSLVLRSIRAVTATGEVYEDDTVRTPYQLH